MDPRKNPYGPGAGTKPAALVGRVMPGFASTALGTESMTPLPVGSGRLLPGGPNVLLEFLERLRQIPATKAHAERVGSVPVEGSRQEQDSCLLH